MNSRDYHSLTEAQKRYLWARRIGEDGVRRILQHNKHGMIIVSAARGQVASACPGCDLSEAFRQWCDTNRKDSASQESQDEFLRLRNKDAEKLLRDNLKEAPYAYSNIFSEHLGGNSGEAAIEPSFIIYCHAKHDWEKGLDFSELQAFGLALCRKFCQESFFVQAPGKSMVSMDHDGNALGDVAIMLESLRSHGPECYTSRMRRDQQGEVFLFK